MFRLLGQKAAQLVTHRPSLQKAVSAAQKASPVVSAVVVGTVGMYGFYKHSSRKNPASEAKTASLIPIEYMPSP
jgi:hypothetical protein